MSKQAMREETERLVKEALERKTLTVKQGKTYRQQMPKVRRAESRLGSSRTGSGAVHV
jgi:phage shock protein A